MRPCLVRTVLRFGINNEGRLQRLGRWEYKYTKDSNTRATKMLLRQQQTRTSAAFGQHLMAKQIVVRP